MNKFSWYEAKSVEDALGKVNATVSEILAKNGNQTSAIFKAGGVDLLDLMKEGLVRPGMVIGIKNIPGLDKIDYDAKTGLRIGANVSLSEMESNDRIRDQYQALFQAVSHAGTPQIRNSATLGGNLAQRTRCWYFRSIDHDCYRKGSGTCFAQEGENEFHAVMDNQPCASVHSSSVATALLAFNAKVEILSSDGKKREVKMEDFFVHPSKDSRTENILKANEMITAVTVPAAGENIKSYYIKQGARESHDWALADVAVVAEMSGTRCKKAEIALGAASPVPVKAKAAADSLAGKEINEASAVNAGEIAMKNATPLANNGYKVPLFKTIIKRAILKTV
ncbi:MAG: FAD binding domain-containing protein [Cyclobacteriaceae bacterium]|nr:FAD binding domain-containing protein [Cyclobacteriaceae bacterium]